MVKITTTGWLADQARAKGVLQQATKEGTKKLLPQVKQAVIDKLDRSLVPPEESGRFKGSITTRIYDSGTGVVKSNDTRRIKTWIERRTRGGKRLGKGAYPFRAGKTFAKKAIKQDFYAPFLVRALRD